MVTRNGVGRRDGGYEVVREKEEELCTYREREKKLKVFNMLHLLVEEILQKKFVSGRK